jgi:hypothetical protein
VFDAELGREATGFAARPASDELFAARSVRRAATPVGWVGGLAGLFFGRDLSLPLFVPRFELLLVIEILGQLQQSLPPQTMRAPYHPAN